MSFESKIEEEFYRNFNYKKIKFNTTNKEYEIKAIKPFKRSVPYDLSINIGSRIIAIINFNVGHSHKSYSYYSLDTFALENNIRFTIISDGVKFLVNDTKEPSNRLNVNFDELLELLSLRYKGYPLDINTQVAKKIKEIIIESNFPFLKEEINHLYSQLLNGIDYNEIDQHFSFKEPSNINSIENKIFRLLLQDNTPLTRIYRYTTLNSIYSTLTNNSFRMNCLVGMNDTSEVNYAENYISGSNRDYTTAHWKTVDAFNRRFISSCSLKEDDLTQWRLYSDDSKGVCLILDVKQELLNSKFILKRISYGNKDGTHPVLDFIKNIISTLKNDFNIDFEFKTLSTWRHFFKPFDYTIEEEVRLLFMHRDEEIKKGWLLTSTHSILNPYVEFKLNDDELPIQLIEIVLGPKCPEKEMNMKQFEQLIRELKLKKKKIKVGEDEQEFDEYKIPNLTVSISRIKNYR
jgi:hypothetical protein